LWSGWGEFPLVESSSIIISLWHLVGDPLMPVSILFV
jgi:hypothetical protein